MSDLASVECVDESDDPDVELEEDKDDARLEWELDKGEESELERDGCDPDREGGADVVAVK